MSDEQQRHQLVLARGGLAVQDKFSVDGRGRVRHLNCSQAMP
jgi:hypothetical protein